ncbi:hypothetical protein DL93DRAFT_298652 [Clavulina sp. PMI_390]|nr:hypothetical protein DL93DRAFT_298652 [Clavulina sp. PMI_390]
MIRTAVHTRKRPQLPPPHCRNDNADISKSHKIAPRDHRMTYATSTTSTTSTAASASAASTSTSTPTGASAASSASTSSHSTATSNATLLERH